MFFKKGKNKFGAKRTDLGYDSKLEQSVHAILKLREANGEISDVKSQQTIVLQDGPQNMRITLRIDFSFIQNGQLVYAEAKGFELPEWKLKLKLYRKNITNKLEIWKGTAKRPFLAEVING